MSVTGSNLSTDLANSTWLLAGQLDLRSPIDMTCNVSEVRRLLWSALTVAIVAGGYCIARPNWRRVAGLAGAAFLWLWIDMEGPVLVSRGSHGLHFADLPVVVALLASATTAMRLLLPGARRAATAP